MILRAILIHYLLLRYQVFCPEVNLDYFADVVFPLRVKSLCSLDGYLLMLYSRVLYFYIVFAVFCKMFALLQVGQ